MEVESTVDVQRASGVSMKAGVTADDVVITVGGNMAFLATIMALCPPRTSSVLLPMPNYFSHAMSLSLQSVRPVHLACDPDDNFFPSLPAAREYLEACKNDTATPRSNKVEPRLILLINPSNPTGAVMPPDRVREWYALAKEYGIALVVDETYRDFVVGETDDVMGVPHHLFAEKDWRETVISLGSFSSTLNSERCQAVLAMANNHSATEHSS